MSDIAHRRRGPWCGLGSLSIALCLLAAIHFLTTAEGQRWVEDFFRPLGYAAILLGIVGPALFLGMSGLVLLLAISAGIRHEPYRLGELALTIVLSLFFQIGSSRADLWSTFPSAPARRRRHCFRSRLGRSLDLAPIPSARH